MFFLGFPGGTSGKESPCQCRRRKRRRCHLWVGKSLWRRKWQPAPVFFLENSMGRGAWRATVHGAKVGHNWMHTHTQCPFCICKWNLREWLRAKILDVPIDISLQVVSTWAPHHHRESPVGDLLKYRSILNSFASAGVVLTALPPFGEKICWETSEEKKIHCG